MLVCGRVLLTPVSRVFRLSVVHFWACSGGVVLEEFLGSMQRFLFTLAAAVCVLAGDHRSTLDQLCSEKVQYTAK